MRPGNFGELRKALQRRAFTYKSAAAGNGQQQQLLFHLHAARGKWLSVTYGLSFGCIYVPIVVSVLLKKPGAW